MLTRQVLLSSNLLPLVERYNLYPEMRSTATAARLTDRMREDVGIALLSTEVNDPRAGRPGEITVAFEVSFVYPDPTTARRVTDELVSLFLATNLEERREVADQTAEFFTNERAAVEQRIAELEEELTDFQTENRDLLPEEIAFSRQQLANVEQQLSELDRDLRALKEREGFLTTQLSLMDEFEAREPDGRNATPESQLEVARAELATARARYSASRARCARSRRWSANAPV
jgi:uncharacterized protein involved in exopolysaccharide biosynthesis